MTDNLNNLISNINNAADQVAGGAKQVSDSSIELSQGATLNFLKELQSKLVQLKN